MTKKTFSSGIPFSFSWSKVSLFLDCPRCFYLDVVKGIVRPASLPLSLNLAVDKLLKTESDIYRQNQTPQMFANLEGTILIPYQHNDLENWRDNKIGIKAVHAGYEFYGAIDDIWRDAEDKLYIVDYKATSNPDPLFYLRFGDREYYQKYFYQLEFYQYLFILNGYNIADHGYILLANADAYQPQFNNQLNFNLNLVPNKRIDGRIQRKLDEMIQCVSDNKLPAYNKSCRFCSFAEKRKVVL